MLVILPDEGAARLGSVPAGGPEDSPLQAGRRRHRRWLEAEDAFLRRRYKTMAPQEIAARLGRTRVSVTQRASKVLSIRRRTSPTTWRKWEPDDETQLRAMYGRMPTRAVAVSLHRTVSSIHSRAHRLGLARVTVRGPNRPWTSDDESYVLREYTKLPTRDIAGKLNRTIAAVTARALRPRWGAAARRRRRKVWKPAEDAILRSDYGVAGTDTLAQTLGRSAGALHSRAHKLGLTRPTAITPPRDWTATEDAFLRASYGNARSNQIALQLGRTRGSVLHRAERLRLTSALRSPEFQRRQSLPRTAPPFIGLSSPRDIGYVAGIIDGEGSIIGPPKFAVQVSMTNPEVIRHLAELCGGSVTGPYEHRSGKSEVCKPQYHWTISSAENAYRLLKLLLPQLIVKKEKAVEMIHVLEEKWSV